MGLSTELARVTPRVPHPYLPRNKKSALEIEANKAAAIFGGVAQENDPPEGFLSKVEIVLGEDGSGLQKLGLLELKVVPYIIWGPNVRLRTDRRFVRRYLDMVTDRWRTAARRLWRHYVFNFDADSPATVEFAAWLREHADKIPEPLRHFSKEYSLFDVKQAPGALAAAALGGQRLIDDMEPIGFPLASLRTSGLLMAVLSAAGRQLATTTDTHRAPERLSALLDGNPNNAIAEALCSEAARSQALRSLVDGLVAWHGLQDPDDAQPEPTLDFLLALNGDPRFVRERWQGRVSDASIQAVERWLSRKTIEAFFRVIDALQTDRPDMWQARRQFWLSYLPYVSKAWLVAGPRAVPLAEREGLRYGQFVHGQQQDQCGLILQIRGTCVMEMNKNGSAIFWESGAHNLPGLYMEMYNRSHYKRRVDGRSVFVLKHQGDWQRRFNDQILQMTGINRQ
jgi:hypothetical protein